MLWNNLKTNIYIVGPLWSIWADKNQLKTLGDKNILITIVSSFCQFLMVKVANVINKQKQLDNFWSQPAGFKHGLIKGDN